ncbi:MAG: uroporphyrinogen decarboxylase family protein [Moorellales bacterium]
MPKTAQELYQERLKRIEDAIALRVPDRVPITVGVGGFFAARYSGISYQDYMYDPEKIMAAAIRTHEDFQPDLASNPFGLFYLGPMLDAVGFRQLRWPGRGVGFNDPYQFVEGEYMKPEEYDHFISDPSDWMMRRYLPRVCGALEPFSRIAPMRDVYAHGGFHHLAPFATEEVQRALQALVKAGEAAAVAARYAERFREEMAKRGFPQIYGGMAQAPFDLIGDFFRGTQGILLDMYRRPDKLKRAMEVVIPWQIEGAVASAKASGNRGIFIALHKGSNEFMSLEQFKTFYWPGLREVIWGLVREGLTPMVFLESDYGTRLEIMRDVPEGKVVYHLEKTDIFRAKEILGDRVCLRGNVPSSLLCVGTPEEVREYCKKLIDVVGRDGGFILDTSSGIDDARIENVRAMINFTREYGVYR